MTKFYRQILSTSIRAFVATVAIALSPIALIGGHNPESSQDYESKETSDDSAVRYLGENRSIITTGSLPGQTPGYGGPMNIAIYLTADRIDSVRVISSRETPRFLKRTNGLIRRWDNMTVAEALKIKPDAVSGATYSSRAIIANVHIGLEHMAQLQASNTAKSSFSYPITIIVSVALLIGVLCIAFKRIISYRKQQPNT